MDEWRATFSVNVFGAVALTMTLLPALRQARGQVVFINSGAGRNVSPGMASYSASKFALRAFADSLRADEPALLVTSVHPGRVDTDMQHELVAHEGGEYDPAKFLRPTPSPRSSPMWWLPRRTAMFTKWSSGPPLRYAPRRRRG